MTADVSKLVNLRTLQLNMTHKTQHLPDSISCLQKLELLAIDAFDVGELPAGLAKLENLVILHLFNNGHLWDPDLPFNVQVTVLGLCCSLTLVYTV
jgi:hypothetical protein